MHRLTILFFCLFVLPVPSQSATIHVPGDQPTIQAGINAAAFAGDTVLVAPGAYTGIGNKNLTTMGKAIVVASELGADSTIIDCESQGRAFSFKTGETQSTIIDGFTLRGGAVIGAFPDSWGGGILCVGSSPTIRNCVIAENAATGNPGCGGGIGLFDSSPELSNCRIESNNAGEGGGIHCQSQSSPSMVNCVIFANSATTRGGGVAAMVNSSPSISGSITMNSGSAGGGVYIDATSFVSFQDCSLEHNLASAGGGIYYAGPASFTLEDLTLLDNDASSGGGIYIESASACTINNASFMFNRASSGSAIYVGPGTAAIMNCRFYGNDAGSAIVCVDSSSPTIEDCAFVENNGGVNSVRATPTVLRCVFDSNASFGVMSWGAQSLIHMESCTLYQNEFGVQVQNDGAVVMERTIIAFSQGSAVLCAGAATLSCCDLYANLGGNWIDCISGQEGVNGNFTANPRFCDMQNADFTLHGQSPCAPGNSPAGCDLIGALPVGCGVADVETETAPSAELALTVIPNPVRSVARFELEGAAPSATITIFDSMGRIVEQLTREEGHWLWTPGSAVPAGVYFGKPETGTGSTAAVKFLYLR